MLVDLPEVQAPYGSFTSPVPCESPLIEFKGLGVAKYNGQHRTYNPATKSLELPWIVYYYDFTPMSARTRFFKQFAIGAFAGVCFVALIVGLLLAFAK